MGNSQQSPVPIKKRSFHYKKKGGQTTMNIQNTMDESSTDEGLTAPGPAALGPDALGPAALGPAALGPAAPAQANSCPPCPPCLAEGEKKEGFFEKLSPKKLNDQLAAAQTSMIENSKNKISSTFANAKAGLAGKITGILGAPTVVEQSAGKRMSRKRTKSKRSKSKRSKSKRSKSKKRSGKKRSTIKRR
jgi:hypothetical protein